MPAKKKAAKPVPRPKTVKKAKPAPKKAAKKAEVKKKPPVKKSVPKKPLINNTKSVKKIVKKATKPVQKKSSPSKPAATKKAAPAKVVKKEAPKKAAPSKPVNKAVSKPKTVPPKEEKTVKKPTTQSQTVKPEVKSGTTVSTKGASIKTPVSNAIKELKSNSEKPARPKDFKPPVTSVSTVKPYQPDFVKSVLDKGEPEHQSKVLVRYSDAELAEFKELIVKKLDTAKKELIYLQGLITHKDAGNGDDGEGRYMTMENGSESMEREQLSQMASRQITYIDHLEKALMRVENKTYGVCRVTGKLIEKARLKAVPHATLSMEAKLGQHKIPAQSE